MTRKNALPRWLKPANGLVKTLQRLGLPFGTIHVLSVPGRVSRQPRATPVSTLTVGGHRYTIAALPNGDWARNARAAQQGTLSRGRRHEEVRLNEVHDQEISRAVLRAFPAAVPQGVRFFKRLGLVRHGDPSEFEAIADRVSVFEILTARS